MATILLRLCVFVSMFGVLYCNNISPEVRRELVTRVVSGQTNESEIHVYDIVFRNLRMINVSTLEADYDIESNDVLREFPRSGTLREYLGSGFRTSERALIENGKVASQFGEKPSRNKIAVIVDELNEFHTKENKIKTSPSREIIGETMVLEYNFGSKENQLEEVTQKIMTPKEYKWNTGSDIFNKENEVSIPGTKHANGILDKVVDMLLQLVREEIHISGDDQVVIPNVDVSFPTKILFIPVEGRFQAEHGWFRNLSTIYRTGEVVATPSFKKKTLRLEFDLGLKDMEFGFEHYYAELAGIGASGSIYGSIASDSVDVQLTLAYVNGTCKANLNSLKVTRLNGIHVILTGWDGFGWLLTFIANCVSGSYRDSIISAVEKLLSHTIEDKLSKISCEHLFPWYSNELKL